MEAINPIRGWFYQPVAAVGAGALLLDSVWVLVWFTGLGSGWVGGGCFRSDGGAGVLEDP